MPYSICPCCSAPEAPHFSPSAIALSALLLSFSKLGMDCTDWLEHVPNICLPSPVHPIFNTPSLVSFLDVDNCLAVFQRMQTAAATAAAAQSQINKNSAASNQSSAPQTPLTACQQQQQERIISPNSVVDLNDSPARTGKQLNNAAIDKTGNTTMIDSTQCYVTVNQYSAAMKCLSSTEESYVMRQPLLGKNHNPRSEYISDDDEEAGGDNKRQKLAQHCYTNRCPEPEV